MAVDADVAEQVAAGAVLDEKDQAGASTAGPPDDHGSQDVEQRHTAPAQLDDDHSSSRRRVSVRSVLVAMLIVGSSLTGLLAWFSWQDRQGRHTTTRNNLYIEVGKQAALNLTTISYRDVDAQVQRILASSTGSFHDDFQQRATPFVDVVKKAQSQSIGTVTAAGLESVDGDQARVLVAVSVTTTIGTGPQQDPRGWRMRIDVTRDGQEGIKVSNVEFVP